MVNLVSSASMEDVVAAAGIEKDPRGNYRAKKYRTCLHDAALFASMDSALRAKDQEIARLNAQLTKSYRFNSELAGNNADQATQLAKATIDRVRIGLENHPEISEVERNRLIA